MRDRSAGHRQIAVAIKDQSAGGQLPHVVARGHGTVAEQILSLAFAEGIKIREDADLVEILEATKIDCEIPTFALAAVAEILSYVYRANGQDPLETSVATVEDPIGVANEPT